MPQIAGVIPIGIDTSAIPRQFAAALARAQRAAPVVNLRFNSQPLGRITGEVKELTKSLEASSARVLAFGATTGIIYSLGRAFTELVKSTVLVEKKLKDIQVILGASSANFAKLSNGIFEIAQETAKGFEDVASAAEEFARQGLPLNETLKRTRDSLILARLSSIDAKEAVNALTAAVNTFGKEALDTTTIINKLANVDAAFAVSQKDLAQAISRVGSAASDANVSFDELLATVASAQQTTARGGAAIGNSLKTIFTRLQRPQSVESLKALGVQLQATNGESLNAIQVLTNLSKVYNTLSESQRNNISQQIAGVHQINIFKALISDLSRQYSILNRAQEVSANSTNEATQRNQELNTTLAAQAQKAGTNITKVLAKIGDISIAPTFKSFLLEFNQIFENLGKSGKGQEGGTSVAEGFLKGLGSALRGPGAIILASIFIGLFKKVGAFAFDSIKELAGLNTASGQQQALQKNINGLLQTGNSYYVQRLSQARTVGEQEAIILKLIQSQNAEVAKQAAMFAAVSARIGKSFVTSGTGFSRKAEGYVPTANAGLVPALVGEAAAIKRGVGGASASSKTAVIPNFNFGGGKKGPVVANTSEYVVNNFRGGSGSAIFNPQMIKKAGGLQALSQLGNVAKVASNGFVPNFAGGSLLRKSSFSGIKPSPQIVEQINSLEQFLRKDIGLKPKQLPNINVQSRQFKGEQGNYVGFFDPASNSINISTSAVREGLGARPKKREFEKYFGEILFHEGFHGAYRGVHANRQTRKAAVGALGQGERFRTKKQASDYLLNEVGYSKRDVNSTYKSLLIEEASAVKFGRQKVNSFAGGFVPNFANDLIISPKAKYIYDDTANYDDRTKPGVTPEKRAFFRQQGYELLTDADFNTIAKNKEVQKLIKSGKKLQLFDPSGTLKPSSVAAVPKQFRGQTLGLDKGGYNALTRLFNVASTSNLPINKLQETQLGKGLQPSVLLSKFLGQNGLGEIEPRNIKQFVAAAQKSFPGGAFLKTFGSVQSKGVFSLAKLAEGNFDYNTLPKGDSGLLQRAIPNATGVEYRVNTAGVAGKARVVGDILPRMVNGNLVEDAFQNLTRPVTLRDIKKDFVAGGKNGVSLRDRISEARFQLEGVLDNNIAAQQARNALNSLPAEYRRGSLGGFDVAQTGTKGVVKKSLQLLGEKIGIPLFKGGGVIEFNLGKDYRDPNPTTFSGSRNTSLLGAARAIEDNSRGLSEQYVKRGQNILGLSGPKRELEFGKLYNDLLKFEDIDKNSYLKTVKALGDSGFGLAAEGKAGLRPISKKAAGNFFSRRGFAGGYVPNFAPAPKFVGSGAFGSFYDLGTKIQGVPIGKKVFHDKPFYDKRAKESHIRDEYNAAEALGFGVSLGAFGPGVKSAKVFNSRSHAFRSGVLIKELVKGGSPGEVASRLIRSGRYEEGSNASRFAEYLESFLQTRLGRGGIRASDLHGDNFIADPRSAQSILELFAKGGRKASSLASNKTSAFNFAEDLIKKGGSFNIIDSGKLRTQYSDSPDINKLREAISSSRSFAGGYTPNFANGLNKAIRTERILTGEIPRVGTDPRLPGKVGVYSPSQGNLKSAIDQHLKSEPGRNLGNLAFTGVQAQSRVPNFAPVTSASSSLDIATRLRELSSTLAKNNAIVKAKAEQEKRDSLVNKANAGERISSKDRDFLKRVDRASAYASIGTTAREAGILRNSGPDGRKLIRNLEARSDYGVQKLIKFGDSQKLNNQISTFFAQKAEKGGLFTTAKSLKRDLNKQFQGQTFTEAQKVLARDGIAKLAGEKKAARNQALFGLSFAAPLLAQTGASILGANGESRTSRTASGIIEGAATGGTIAALLPNKGGIIGGAAIAIVQSLRAITSNVAPTLEEFLKKIENSNNVLNEQTNAITQSISAFDQLQTVAGGGGSNAAIKRASNSLVQNLGQVNGPNKAKLLEAIQSGDIEKLRDVQAENLSSYTIKQKGSQFIGKFAELNDKTPVTGELFSDALIGSRRNLIASATDTTGSRSAAISKAVFERFTDKKLTVGNARDSFKDLNSSQFDLLKDYTSSIPLKSDKIDLDSLIKQRKAGTDSTQIIKSILKTSGVEDPNLDAALLTGSINDTNKIADVLINRVSEAKKDAVLDKKSQQVGRKVRDFVKLSEDVIQNVAFSFSNTGLDTTSSRNALLAKADSFVANNGDSLTEENKQRIAFSSAQLQNAGSTSDNINSIIIDKISQARIPSDQLRIPEVANQIAQSVSNISKNPTNISSELSNIGDALSAGGAEKELVDSFKKGGEAASKELFLAIKQGGIESARIIAENEAITARIKRNNESKFLGGDFQSLKNSDFSDLNRGFSAFRNNKLIGQSVGGSKLGQSRRDASILGDQATGILELDKLGILPKEGEKRDSAREIIRKAIEANYNNALDQIGKNSKGSGFESIIGDSKSLVSAAARTKSEELLPGGIGVSGIVDSLNSETGKTQSSISAISEQINSIVTNTTSLNKVDSTLAALNSSLAPLNSSIRELTVEVVKRTPELNKSPVAAKASGFIPNFSAYGRELSAIKLGIGGARPSDKPTFKNVAGLGPAVLNTGETLIKNYLGSGKDAVFNRNMANEYGGSLSDLGDVEALSGGFVPNFANKNTRKSLFSIRRGFKGAGRFASQSAQGIFNGTKGTAGAIFNSKLGKLLFGKGSLIAGSLYSAGDSALDSFANLSRKENQGLGKLSKAGIYGTSLVGAPLDVFRLLADGVGGAVTLGGNTNIGTNLLKGAINFGGGSNQYEGGNIGSFLADQVTELVGAKARPKATKTPILPPNLPEPTPEEVSKVPANVLEFVSTLRNNVDYLTRGDLSSDDRKSSETYLKSNLKGIQSALLAGNGDKDTREYYKQFLAEYPALQKQAQEKLTNNVQLTNLLNKAQGISQPTPRPGIVSDQELPSQSVIDGIRRGSIIEPKIANFPSLSDQLKNISFPSEPKSVDTTLIDQLDQLENKFTVKPPKYGFYRQIQSLMKIRNISESEAAASLGYGPAKFGGFEDIYNRASGFIPNFAYNRKSIFSRRARAAMRNLGASSGFTSSKTVGPLTRIKQLIDNGNIEEARDAILNGGLPASFARVGLDENNLGGVSAAIQREYDSLVKRGVPKNLAGGYIFTGTRPEIGGIGVGNYIDEPRGLINPNLGILQGINRVKSQGGNPSSSGSTPNFADDQDLSDLISTLKDLISTLANKSESKESESSSSVTVDHNINVSAAINGQITSTNSEVQNIIDQTIQQLKARIAALESAQKNNKDYVPRPPVVAPKSLTLV